MRDTKLVLADLMVLSLLGTNLVLNPPNLQYLSGALALPPTFGGDVLSGTVGCAGVVLAVLYAACMASDSPRAQRNRLAIVLLFAALFVALPAASDMASRATRGLVANGQYVSFPHDGGVLQTEAAMDFLAAGQNPYTAYYGGTAMAQSHHSQPEMWHAMGLKENPAYTFLPYPPGNLLLALPVAWLTRACLGWYDQRLFYLAAWFALAIVGARVPADRHLRLLAAACLLLCPWSIRFVIQGYNDVVCVLFLVGMIAALRANRSRAAGVWLALACGAKQFAWFGMPFYAAWLWAEHRARPPSAPAGCAWTKAVPGLLVLAVTFLPFFLWNPAALIRSLVIAQGYEYPFRIQGLGIANLLVLRGLVRTPMDTFPLGVFHLLFTLPALSIGVYRTARGAGLPVLLRALALSLLCFLLFSRHFAPNYFWLPTVLFLASWLMESPEAGGGGQSTARLPARPGP